MVTRRILVSATAFYIAIFPGAVFADAIRDTIQIWTQELRKAEEATPTDHPAIYNSQTGVFFISIFEAVNASTGKQWNTLSGTVLPNDARAELAATFAAHAALSSSYESSSNAIDARLTELIADATGEEIDAARAVGVAAYTSVIATHPDVRETFFLSDSKQFMPGPPPAIESNKYAFDYNEVKLLGGANSTERSQEQTETAVFWSDNRTGTMAALTYNAENILAGKDLEGVAFARGMALFAGGLHDALLSVSASKSVYETARPIDAIHGGDADGNARTEGDPTWVMFGNNVPPEDLSFSYASGGGTLSSFFANMIGLILDTDQVNFEFAFLYKPDTRSFESLSDMQLEFGRSRIYNGEHFMHDVEAGWLMSEQIANFVYANSLAPVDQ